MQNNTNAFSWKRGKDKSRKLRTNIPRKPSSFLLFSIDYYKDALKSQLQLCMTICDPPQDFNAKGENTRTTRFHFKTKEFILTRLSTLAILPH